MADKTYDVIVIGGGPGGYPCAIRLGQLKQKVLCIEKEEVGGVCLNWGCVPSKAIIATSHTFEKVRHGATFGLLTDNPRIDADKLQDWKDGIVKKLTTGVRGLFKGNGVELLYGEARIAGPKTVTVRTREGTTETIAATKAIVVATGSSTIEIPSFKFDGKQIIGAKEAVSLRAIPKRLLVIGGGIIGMELGGAYQNLGSELTVVEALPTVLTGVDPDVAAVVERSYVKRGAKVIKGAKALGYEKQTDGSIAVRVDVAGTPLVFHGAPGHTPGSCLLEFGHALFSGDTIYCRGVGLSQLPGEQPETLKASILASWPLLGADRTIYPGHGRCASGDWVRANNQPLLQFLGLPIPDNETSPS